MKSLEAKIVGIVAKEPTCNWKLAELLNVPYRTVQRATLKLNRERRIIPACGSIVPAFWTIWNQEEIGANKKK
jgi:hypothetical protein